MLKQHSPVPVEIRRHGLLGAAWTYALLDARQREVAARVRDSADDAPGALLLSEVAPVITFGKRATHSELMVSPAVLAASGVELFETDRGGLATYHGPGQWVLFAVDRLDRLTGDPRGVRKAVEGLLQTALEVARLCEPMAEIRSGLETGVWSPRGKLASVGVQIEQGVLLHGLSINGYRTQTSFMGLRPCGLDAPVDFLLGNESSPSEFDELGAKIIEATFRNFYCRTASPSLDGSGATALYPHHSIGS